jgi:hypothetical protein
MAAGDSAFIPHFLLFESIEATILLGHEKF